MILDRDHIHSILDERLDQLDDLASLADSSASVSERDRQFIDSLTADFLHYHTLSGKQWHWVGTLLERYTSAEPIYGSFDPIRVMFRLAVTNGNLKVPKIRLLSSEGRYVQLNFYPDTSVIKVFVDGWQGHGRRKFAGVVEDNCLKPWSKDRMTPDVKNVIQDLALDPIGTAKAMAKLLSACMYCGSRLSDPPSKEAGYGPTCAQNYELPWGGKDNKQLDLDALFSPRVAGPEIASPEVINAIKEHTHS